MVDHRVDVDAVLNIYLIIYTDGRSTSCTVNVCVSDAAGFRWVVSVSHHFPLLPCVCQQLSVVNLLTRDIKRSQTNTVDVFLIY